MGDELEFDTAGALTEISGSLFSNSESEDSGDVKLEDNPEPTEGASASEDASAKPAAEVSEETPAAPAAEGAKPAPRTWRPEAAAAWASLPPTVQEEVLKREEEIFRGIEQYKTHANYGREIQQAMAPYEPILQRFNATPAQAVSQLMGLQQVLLSGTAAEKRQLVEGVIRTYGIDMGQPGEEAPYTDPQVADLRAKLAAIESNQQRAEAEKQASIRATLKAELDAFATDPAHPYFDEVADDIGALLRGGGAKGLKDAYEKAVWANPVTRAKEQSRALAEAQAKDKKEAEERAAQARKATSANVRSNAKTVSSTAPLGSIDDTLAATLRDLKSRSQ